MKFSDLATTVRDSVSVRRVYGDPIERDGALLVPAAMVSGGAGGGNGHDEKGQEGEGGGFGIGARPVGAYVLKDGKAAWMPAVDVNRLVLVCGAVAIAYLITRARVAKARAKLGG
ncbi:spore germination protein GerW family protein [Amycolatopsis alkalitolerans]|uniref:Sporulation protein n=1 Tax=Amycolatopsis alkalitolerans TaxID=2547244 RepID=A0A5C4LUE8_9PSEU|nr:spore germination protein GerW family protein [Amycolatopsis alkalitolerans]TNC21783.1 sporulation protein [Amycolatopsis alkalitolerans]